MVFEINLIHINNSISQRLFSDPTATESPMGGLMKIYIPEFDPKPWGARKTLREHSLQNH